MPSTDRVAPTWPRGTASLATGAPLRVVPGVTLVDESLGSWQVEVMSRESGLGRVTRTGEAIQLRVGDRSPPAVSSPGVAAQRLRSLLVADLAANGFVHVVTRCAPPALVVSPARVSLLPAHGRVEAERSLEPGDILVMCSAATLDAHPAGVVSLLKQLPHVAPDAALRQLVRRVAAGSPEGAAAVARWSPAR